MMEAAPPAPFIVSEPDLLLEFLIVSLDMPAQLGKVDELAEAEIRRQRQYLVGAASPSGHSTSNHSCDSNSGISWLCPTRTRTRAKRDDSHSAEPSRHRIVRQACLGRSSASCLTEIRSGSSRRTVLFSRLPLRFGPAPGGHTRIFG